MTIQIGIKFNDEEEELFNRLKKDLRLKGTYGEDSQTIKKAIEFTNWFIKEVKPHFQLYELLFVKAQDRRFLDNPKDRTEANSTHSTERTS